MATSSDPYAAQYVPISSSITEPARPAILVNGGPPPSSAVPTLPSAFVSSGTGDPASTTPTAPVYVTSGQSFTTSAVPGSLPSTVSYVSQQVAPPPQGSFYLSAAPLTNGGPPPALLPPVPPTFRDGGWGGRWSGSSGDLPGIRTLRGGIVTCLMILLVCSLFACLGRADFSFVLYLLGYHLWCVEADTKSVTGVKRLLRGARQYAVLLCIASVVEITWLFIAYSTWVCEKGDAELCFPESENLKVRWTYGIHNWALGLSTFNLLVKLVLIFLSFTWVQQQRSALGLSSGGSGTGGTSILPSSSE